MKEFDKKKNPNSHQVRRSGRSERKDRKLLQDNVRKTLTAKENESKASRAKPDLNKLASESNTSTEPLEVYENMVIHYVDDVNGLEEASQDSKTHEMVDKETKDELNGHSSDADRELKQGNEEESDSETIKDSVSSQGDSQTAEDEKLETPSTVPIKVAALIKKSDHETIMASNTTPKKGTKPNKGQCKETIKNVTDKNSKNVKVSPKPSSESSEGVDEKPLEDVKEMDVLDEASNGAQSVGTDGETVNGEPEDQAALDQKIEEMEKRIGKLEAELREVAALEISLYSVVPEHGSSAHKVHTPARRLSRLYIHACKNWVLDKRATVARNTVSGLVLVAKSCSNDVQRLTFWLSNTVVLREIISQAFGNSCSSSSISNIFELNGGGKKSDGKSPSLKWKANFGGRQTNKHGLIQFVDDWQETRTFTAALEKVESWIFSRIVESIWWQSFTPSMQSPNEDLNANKTHGRLSGPALGDQQQGNFSINLWKNAFQDAFKRLCPVRGGGHECGCLPVLARMVMEHCVARLDVAMFNAILRESAEEIPTDPVSDPIIDSKVLPIPAGDLSFGSGAQLKNSVGNWSRCLTELFGMDANDSPRDDQCTHEDDATLGGDAELKHFHLVNALSDLLMLPKDMLIDRSILTEVCPSISLPLVKRILCNFTPDEFCPDPVPGTVLEALNAECIIEQRLSGDGASSFPYNAAAVIYTPPSSANVAEKVAEAGGKSQLARNASVIQRKGYTSDEELEELNSPLTSIIDKLPSSPTVMRNGNRNRNGKHDNQTSDICGNARYELLHEVWLA
ncbi:Protein gar2 like [Actinidia chinensis var. chinensis]|uniref:Protein gar2 like n=1 Tax=Actinidia chinensis var. chinensis TaxID=1590841 RepID=A0A2R6QV65_ACTCC|nr:Protein gar2 like [Actinidia chinensis var. chinensis]